MNPNVSGARSKLAIRAPLALLAVLLIAAAGPLAVYAGAGTAVQQVQAALAKSAPQAKSERREMRAPLGRDVDGDGAPDFVNPTDKGVRDVDNFGSGHFLASRDGGVRRHEGVDYVSTAGQDVQAPISGYVTKIGYAYSDDANFRYVELTNRAIGYVARVFYVQPVVVLGQAVRLGQVVGTTETLRKRYPGITDHVHVELAEIARGHVDPNKFIPSPEMTL
jgi:peptidoglycan LD-endopeptidase LytH